MSGPEAGRLPEGAPRMIRRHRASDALQAAENSSCAAQSRHQAVYSRQPLPQEENLHAEFVCA
jgi:hypothetical protein